MLSLDGVRRGLFLPQPGILACVDLPRETLPTMRTDGGWGRDRWAGSGKRLGGGTVVGI